MGPGSEIVKIEETATIEAVHEGHDETLGHVAGRVELVEGEILVVDVVEFEAAI